MATINQWLMSTLLNIRPDMVDNFGVKTSVYDQLKRKGAIDTEEGMIDETDGSPGVIISLLKSGSTNGKFMAGPYDTIDLAPSQPLTGAKYPFKVYRNGITLAYLHERVNSDKKRLTKLLEIEKKRLDIEVPDQIEQSLVWDTITNGPTGLVHLIWPYRSGGGSVTGLAVGGGNQSVGAWNTVGGIDSTTETWWRNQVAQAVALSTTAISDQMDNLEVDIVAQGAGSPDLVIMDKVAFRLYKNELKGDIVIQSTGVLKKGDLHYPVLFYNDNPVIYGVYVFNPEDTAKGIVFMVNTQFTRLTVWKQMNMHILPFVGPFKGNGSQLTRESAILHGFCMTTSNRRANGVLANIPTS